MLGLCQRGEGDVVGATGPPLAVVTKRHRVGFGGSGGIKVVLGLGLVRISGGQL